MAQSGASSILDHRPDAVPSGLQNTAHFTSIRNRLPPARASITEPSRPFKSEPIQGGKMVIRISYNSPGALYGTRSTWEPLSLTPMTPRPFPERK
jgi:hypothetical protein